MEIEPKPQKNGKFSKLPKKDKDQRPKCDRSKMISDRDMVEKNVQTVSPYFLPTAREGNVFRSVCHSVHREVEADPPGRNIGLDMK